MDDMVEMINRILKTVVLFSLEDSTNVKQRTNVEFKVLNVLTEQKQRKPSSLV